MSNGDPQLDEIGDVIHAALEAEDTNIRELAEEVGKDLAKVTLRRLRGEDVDSEILHLHAQSLNLSVAAREKIQDALLDWIGTRARALLTRALGLPA